MVPAPRELCEQVLRVEPVSLAYVAAPDGGSDGAVVRVGLERSTIGPAPRRAVEHEQRSLQQREELGPTAPGVRVRVRVRVRMRIRVVRVVGFRLGLGFGLG